MTFRHFTHQIYKLFEDREEIFDYDNSFTTISINYPNGSKNHHHEWTLLQF